MRQFALALAVLVCPLALAQASSGTAPIQISKVAVTTSAYGQEVTYSVTNVSGKDIRGYVICVLAEKTCGTHIWGIWPPPARASFKAGAVMTERKGLPLPPGGTAAQPGLSLDYVLFSDGSGWGPDKSHHSLSLWGWWNGHMGTLAGLQAALKKGGSEQVLDYLENVSIY